MRREESITDAESGSRRSDSEMTIEEGGEETECQLRRRTGT